MDAYDKHCCGRALLNPSVKHDRAGNRVGRGELKVSGSGTAYTKVSLDPEDKETLEKLLAAFETRHQVEVKAQPAQRLNISALLLVRGAFNDKLPRWVQEIIYPNTMEVDPGNAPSSGIPGVPVAAPGCDKCAFADSPENVDAVLDAAMQQHAAVVAQKEALVLQVERVHAELADIRKKWYDACEEATEYNVERIRVQDMLDTIEASRSKLGAMLDKFDKCGHAARWDTTKNGGRGGMRTPYSELSEHYKQSICRGMGHSIMSYLKMGIGGNDDMTEFLKDMLLKYSAYKCDKSKGVTQDRKLVGDFCDPFSNAFDKYFLKKSAGGAPHHENIDVGQLQELIEDTGVTQKGMRNWRKLLKRSKVLLPSERACTSEVSRRTAIAREVFGAVYKIEATGEENENGEGHGLPLDKTMEGLVRISLHRGAQPDEISDLNKTIEDAQKQVKSDIEAAEKNVEELEAAARECERIHTYHDIPGLSMDSDEEEDSDDEDSDEDGMQTAPAHRAGIDFEVTGADAEAAHRARRDAYLKDRLTAARDQVARAKLYVVKLHAQLRNLKEGYRSAARNGTFKNQCVTAVKEEVVGPLIHKQTSAEVNVKAKVVFDGRQILRVLNKQKKSDQLAAHVSILNGGDAVGSIRSTHTFACTEQGEKEGYHVFRTACQQIRQLEKDGMKLHDVILQTPDGDIVMVDEVTVHFSFVMTPDGANMFKMCAEKCGATAEHKCPICLCSNLVKGDSSSQCQNIGYACQLLKVTDKDLTFEDLCKTNNISFGQLLNLNTVKANASMANEKQHGLRELTIAHMGASTHDTRSSHVIDPDLIEHPGQRIYGHPAIKNKSGNSVAGPPLLRVRIGGFPERPMIPHLADNDITWKHVCLCATHGHMRSMEWLLYLAALHARHENGSTVPITKINAFLEKHDCKIALDTKQGEVQKPTMNGGYQAKLWFEPDNMEPHRKRWEVFVDFIEARPLERQLLRSVWATYEALNNVIRRQLPTKAEQEYIGPATFQHFVAYRRLYSAKYCHLYSHLYFHHATHMMQRLGSIGLFKNESEEAVNSEHKRHIDRHSTKGGLGGSMTYDVMLYSLRKMYRSWADAGLDLTEEDIATIERVTWAEYTERVVTANVDAAPPAA